MEPFPDVLVVSDNDGRVHAVRSGCVRNEEVVVGSLVAEVRNDMILEYQGYAVALHEYTCPRCGSKHERAG